MFEGYGGLTMGTQAVLGGELVWYSENEPNACRVLAHHHPDVPNLGDVTAVDWPNVESVDVLTGGFPCQDVSAAGLRAGMRPDTRSGLWEHMSRAISVLRPSIVVIENVRGLLNAEAHSDVQPCPWCLGDQRTSHMRALGAVLADLARLRYDAAWHGLRAADVGAPHNRFRVFIVATDTDSDAEERTGTRPRGRASTTLELLRPTRGDGATRHTRHRQSVPSGQSAPARNGGRVTADPGREQREPWPTVGERTGRGQSSDEYQRPSAATADADRDGREGRPERDGEPRDGLASLGHDAHGRVLDWGEYGPAVERWEHLTRRTAPTPVEQGIGGGDVLSPAFVEWVMGLPAGHVTDVPGLRRPAQLALLGNGVVPQQAAAAVAWLAPHVDSPLLEGDT